MRDADAAQPGGGEVTYTATISSSHLEASSASLPLPCSRLPRFRILRSR